MPVERLEADGEHLDERPPSEDRVGRVHERRRRDAGRLGRAQRGEEHAVHDEDLGRLTLELRQDVVRDGRVEAEPLPDHRHLFFEVRGDLQWVPVGLRRERDEAGALVAAAFLDRRVPDHAYVVALRDQRPSDPERRHEVARAVPGDHQIASHLDLQLYDLTACKLGYALQHVKWPPRHPDRDPHRRARAVRGAGLPRRRPRGGREARRRLAPGDLPALRIQGGAAHRPARVHLRDRRRADPRAAPHLDRADRHWTGSTR